MTKTDIETKLSALINGNELVIATDQLGGVISITVDSFVTRFKSYDLTYASLLSAVVSGDGWKPYFDAWKAQGLIN